MFVYHYCRNIQFGAVHNRFYAKDHRNVKFMKQAYDTMVDYLQQSHSDA